MPEKTLPFPRGGTYLDGVVTGSDTLASHLEGKLYEVDDTVHGTGHKVILRCVKNDTGSAITIARSFAKFSTTSQYDFGRRVGTFPNDTAGGVCKPMDDAYTVGNTIADDDLFYVVEEGPCWVTSEATTYNITAGDALASDASGLVNGAAAAAGEYVVGTADLQGTAESTAVVVHVAGGLVNSDAAG
jgi:hypothetical protein